MNKRVTFFVVFLPLIAVIAFGGVQLYKTLRNTPERIVQNFVHDLEAGRTDEAYARLSASLTKGREQYWKNYLAGFKSQEGEARLVSQEFVEDTFRTYPSDGDPQRFVYSFQLQNREYLLSIVTFKVKDTWVIAEAHGSQTK